MLISTAQARTVGISKIAISGPEAGGQTNGQAKKSLSPNFEGIVLPGVCARFRT